MSARWLLALAASALLGGLTAQAQTPSKLVTRTYSVADLIVPMPDSSEANPRACLDRMTATLSPASASAQTQEAQLIRVLTNTVAPESWDKSGGKGSVEYFPLTMSLVVNQTPDVQEMVAELLTALRKLQDVTVVAEVKIVSLTDDCLDKCGLDVPSKEGGMMPLDDAQLRRFLEAIQNDRNTNVMQAPKMTMFNGQKANLQVGEEQRLSGQEVLTVAGGQCIFLPLLDQPVFIGQRLSLQPTVSADHKTVQINLDGSLSSRGPGASDEMAAVERLDVIKSFNLADGGTMLINVGTWTCEVRNEFGPPVLSKVPYVNRLFKNVGYGRVTERVLMLVTARVMIDETEEQPTKAAACPCPQTLPMPEPLPCPPAARCPGVSIEPATPTQVMMELCVVRVPADATVMEMFEEVRHSKKVSPKVVTMLDEKQADEVGKMLREMKAEGKVEVLSSPQVCTLSGQTATVVVGQVVRQATAETPEKREGLELKVLPKVSADGRYVSVKMHAEWAEPVRTHEAGERCVNVQRSEFEAVIPESGMVAGRFFNANASKGKEGYCLLVLAKPHVLRAMAQSPPKPLTLCPPPVPVLAAPVPVMPTATEAMEKKVCDRNDYRTPIMPPVQAGTSCEDQPTDAEVLRVMPRVSRGVPYAYDEARDDVRIVYEKLVDRIDPPRFYPLVGPAQLHHCHWKCTVYYTEHVTSGYPFPYSARRPRIEVVYIDKDHLHLFTGPDTHVERARFDLGETTGEKVVTPKKTTGKVEKLMKQYREACADGRLDEAKKLAHKALAIDPACFANTGGR